MKILRTKNFSSQRRDKSGSVEKKKINNLAKQSQGKTPTYADLDKANNRTSKENKDVIETSNDQIEIAASSRIEAQRNK